MSIKAHLEYLDDLRMFLSKIKSSKNIYSFEYLITPEIASYLLEHHNIETNRKLSPSKVLQYAKAIKQGEWIIGDALKFDNKGLLCDGQHRLSAVVRSNIPTEFVITVGYSHESAQVFDRGKPRNLVDVASLRGDTWIKPLHVSIFNTLFFCNPSGRDNPSKMTDPCRIECINRLKEGIIFASQAYEVDGGIKCAAVRGVITRAFYANNPPDRTLLEYFIYYFQGYNPISNPDKFSQDYLHIDPKMAIKLRDKFLGKDWLKYGSIVGSSVVKTKFLLTQKALYNYLQQSKKDCKLVPSQENFFPSKLIDSML
jgi:hypothetical protein